MRRCLFGALIVAIIGGYAMGATNTPTPTATATATACYPAVPTFAVKEDLLRNYSTGWVTTMVAKTDEIVTVPASSPYVCILKGYPSDDYAVTVHTGAGGTGTEYTEVTDSTALDASEFVVDYLGVTTGYIAFPAASKNARLYVSYYSIQGTYVANDFTQLQYNLGELIKDLVTDGLPYSLSVTGNISASGDVSATTANVADVSATGGGFFGERIIAMGVGQENQFGPSNWLAQQGVSINLAIEDPFVFWNLTGMTGASSGDMFYGVESGGIWYGLDLGDWSIDLQTLEPLIFGTGTVGTDAKRYGNGKFVSLDVSDTGTFGRAMCSRVPDDADDLINLTYAQSYVATQVAAIPTATPRATCTPIPPVATCTPIPPVATATPWAGGSVPNDTTFSKAPACVATPASDGELANKTYVDAAGGGFTGGIIPNDVTTTANAWVLMDKAETFIVGDATDYIEYWGPGNATATSQYHDGALVREVGWDGVVTRPVPSSQRFSLKGMCLGLALEPGILGITNTINDTWQAAVSSGMWDNIPGMVDGAYVTIDGFDAQISAAGSNDYWNTVTIAEAPTWSGGANTITDGTDRLTGGGLVRASWSLPIPIKSSGGPFQISGGFTNDVASHIWFRRCDVLYHTSR